MTSRPTVRRIQVDGRHLVAKSATGASRGLLRREAELCTCLEGAQVVRVVAVRESDDRTDLVTEAAGDHDLSSYGSLDPTTLRRALVTAVAAVERLHELGWTHGAICAEHLVVDRAGTSTLCSLGSAQPLDPATAEADAEQLRRVVLHVIERPPRGWTPEERVRWRRWARPARRAIDRTAAAASVGSTDLASLRAAVAVANDHAPRRRLPERPGARIAAVTAAVVLVLAGVAAAVLRQDDVAATRAPTADSDALALRDRTVDARADAAGCIVPSAHAPWTLDMDQNGCSDDVEVAQNLVRVGDLTFRVGEPGDRLALGDWDCDALPTVLLLRPDSGEVFHFDWAATDRPSTGRLLTVVDGATSLSSEVDADGCETATIQRTAGSAVPVPIDADPAEPPGTDPTGHPDVDRVVDPMRDGASDTPHHDDRPDGPDITPHLDGGPP
jgi:hypothetical protein